jgi:spermidine synthase
MEKDITDGVGQQFDVLAVDAFSSDAIPVHLLTAECAEIYAKHLRPGGILAVHISNRFLNLEPVARGMAEQLGWNAVLVENPNDDAQGVYASSWVLITNSPDVIEDPELTVHTSESSDADWILKWTDDYSGLWQVIEF